MQIRNLRHKGLRQLYEDDDAASNTAADLDLIDDH